MTKNDLYTVIIMHFHVKTTVKMWDSNFNVAFVCGSEVIETLAIELLLNKNICPHFKISIWNSSIINWIYNIFINSLLTYKKYSTINRLFTEVKLNLMLNFISISLKIRHCQSDIINTASLAVHCAAVLTAERNSLLNQIW